MAEREHPARASAVALVTAYQTQHSLMLLGGSGPRLSRSALAGALASIRHLPGQGDLVSAEEHGTEPVPRATRPRGRRCPWCRAAARWPAGREPFAGTAQAQPLRRWCRPSLILSHDPAAPVRAEDPVGSAHVVAGGAVRL